MSIIYTLVPELSTAYNVYLSSLLLKKAPFSQSLAQIIPLWRIAFCAFSFYSSSLPIHNEIYCFHNIYLAHCFPVLLIFFLCVSFLPKIKFFSTTEGLSYAVCVFVCVNKWMVTLACSSYVLYSLGSGYSYPYSLNFLKFYLQVFESPELLSHVFFACIRQYSGCIGPMIQSIYERW